MRFQHAARREGDHTKGLWYARQRRKGYLVGRDRDTAGGFENSMIRRIIVVENKRFRSASF